MKGKVEIRWQESTQESDGVTDGFVTVNSLDEAWDVLQSIFQANFAPQAPAVSPHPAGREVLEQLRQHDVKLVKALRQTLSQDLGFTREVVKQLIQEELERQLEDVFTVGRFQTAIDTLVSKKLEQKYIGGLTVSEMINQSTSRLVSKWIADNLAIARRNREEGA
jgi:hypothetical protein